MARDFTKEESNKALVQASFDRWKSATGGPFELLAPDAEWTIVGSASIRMPDAASSHCLIVNNTNPSDGSRYSASSRP